MKLVFATKNPGKVKEMQDLLAALNIKILTAGQAGIHEEIKEDGKTFEENALKKSRYVTMKSGLWSVADDSGLCVDALNGQPGIYSARWAGEKVSDKDIIKYLLKKLKDVPINKRQAYFASAVVLSSPSGKHWTFTGKINGTISLYPKGQAKPKLPYDYVFIPQGHNKTFAQMSDKLKNNLSHRGQAFTKLKKFLKRKL